MGTLALWIGFCGYKEISLTPCVDICKNQQNKNSSLLSQSTPYPPATNAPPTSPVLGPFGSPSSRPNHLQGVRHERVRQVRWKTFFFLFLIIYFQYFFFFFIYLSQ